MSLKQLNVHVERDNVIKLISYHCFLDSFLMHWSPCLQLAAAAAAAACRSLGAGESNVRRISSQLEFSELVGKMYTFFHLRPQKRENINW